MNELKKIGRRIVFESKMSFLFKPILQVKEDYENRDHLRYNLRSKNDGQIYYVVRRSAKNVGLFSYFITTLGGIAFAHEHGYIPVVDLQSRLNSYLYPEEVGMINAWEYYFNQPCGVSVDELKQKRRVIIGRGNPTYSFPKDNYSLFSNQNGELEYWHKICNKYIHIKPDIIDCVKEESNRFKGKCVLGVYCRGTDYIALRPQNHPVQPTTAQVINQVEVAMEEGQFDAIYLTTEDAGILQKFREHFGDRLIVYERKLVNYNFENKSYITSYSTGQKHDKYRQGRDYLVSMLLLQECDGLVTSMASGPVGVFCIGGRYKYQYVFDLGRY